MAVSKAEGRGREGAGSPAITQFTPPPPLFVRFVLRSTNGQRGRRAKTERDRERRTHGEKPATSTHSHTPHSAHNYLALARGRARRARTASGVVVASSNDPFSATAAETASLHVKDMFQSRRQRVPRLSAFFRCKGLSLSTCWAEGSVSKCGT